MEARTEARVTRFHTAHPTRLSCASSIKKIDFSNRVHAWPYMAHTNKNTSRIRSGTVPQAVPGVLGGGSDVSTDMSGPSIREIFGKRSDDEGKGIAGMK